MNNETLKEVEKLITQQFENTARLIIGAKTRNYVENPNDYSYDTVLCHLHQTLANVVEALRNKYLETED